MLKGIPGIISPELLKTIMEMGHGDKIVLADGNFPAASLARRLIRADGHGIPDLLEAILKLFPLDAYVDSAVCLMEGAPGDPTEPEIWGIYAEIFRNSGEKFNGFKTYERFEFYARARNAYAVVATSEKELYANIILQKGVISKSKERLTMKTHPANAALNE